MKSQRCTYLNNAILSTAILLLGFTPASSQSKKIVHHGYFKKESIINDIKDPENSRQLIEVYDKKGRLIQSSELNTEGKKIKDTQYRYTKNAKSVLIYNHLDSLVSSNTTLYNKQGKPIEVSTFRTGKKNQERTVTSYNKWGQKIKEEVFRNGELDKTRIFVYDKQGLMIEQKTTNRNGEVIYHKKIKYSK